MTTFCLSGSKLSLWYMSLCMYESEGRRINRKMSMYVSVERLLAKSLLLII